MLFRVILFIILNCVAFSSAYLWSITIWGKIPLGQPARPGRVLTVFLFFFGQVTLILTCLGGPGILRLPWVTASVFIIFSVTLLLLKKFIVQSSSLNGQRSTFIVDSDPILILLFSLAAVILALVVFIALLVHPFSWDGLTYHLTFPAEWMKRGAIQIIPTPFGDQAPAYSPANGEIFFLWLMLPLRSDFFAKIGGLPFYLLSALSIYLITRRLGGSGKGALLSASIFLITPSIMRHAATPEVDLVALFYFLAATYFLILYLEDRNPRALFLTSMACGLYLGSKYVALAFAPLLMLLTIFAIFFQARKLRLPSLILRDTGIFFAGLLIFGSFWYFRNLIVTGSPVYPMSLGLGGLTFFQGAYPRSVMTSSIFHQQGLRGFFLTNLRAYGGILAFAYPLALLTLIFSKKSPSSPSGFRVSKHHLLLLVAPFLLTGIHWWLVPYNSQWRFLFPAVALAYICVGFIYSKIGFSGLARPLSAVILAMVIWNIFIGLKIRNLGPFVTEAGVFWVLPFTLFITAVLYLIEKRMKGLKRLLCWVILAVIATFGNNLLYWTLFSPHLLPPRARKAPLVRRLEALVFFGQKKLLPVGLAFNYGDFYQGWLWVWRNLSGAKIAYAGHNLPYPLYGKELENEVFYVNINPRTYWKFHDYDLYEREKSGYEVPTTPKPAYYRKSPDYEAWLANLRALNMDFLFLYTLHPNEKKYMEHDEEGFPLENIWARKHPEDFVLLFKNPSIRLYRLKKRAALSQI